MHRFSTAVRTLTGAAATDREHRTRVTREGAAPPRSTGETMRALAGATILATGVAMAVLTPTAAYAVATTPPLGAAANFAVLAGSTVTNTGPSVVTGDLGVSPGTAVTGFPPGTVNGTIHAGDPTAAAAQGDLTTAYNFAAGEACDTNLTSTDLGGLTLPPAVYCSNTSAQLTGTLTLDAQGNPNAAWVFQIGTTLTTASNSAVVLINGATPCNNNNVTWQVGSSATLGTGTSFVGNILANQSISLAAGSNSTGSLLARIGAVTLDTNNVSTCGGAGGTAGPSVTTTPSGSVPAGGNISDTARVIGGASPTGTVTFTLYGPGDNSCANAIATRTGALTGGTASSGNVSAGGAGTYNWVATYNGDADNRPVTSPCGSEKVVVSGQNLTGRAYGLKATATLLGVPLVTVPRTPDTGPVSTTSTSSTTTPCVATVSGLVSAHALCANVTTVAFPGKSTATASTADTTVAIAGIPTVTMRTIESSSTTTCSGSTGSATIEFLKVGNTVVIGAPGRPAPNTGINVGVVSLVLNEQIPLTTPDKGLTVNAVHLKVNTLGLAVVDVIVASSESDIGNCP
ncbi:MAG TPA: ice-binding family protein [Mycobacteriales bacterium]|nr:ice-binding family protein [Mycobacteriales bacterium]